MGRHLFFRVMLLIGLGLAIYFGFESYLLSKGTREPIELSLAALGQPGPIKNAHVTISDFKPSDQFLVQEEHGKWQIVWIPLFTPDGEFTKRPVMAFARHVKGEQDLSARLAPVKLTGVITNGSQGFGQKQQREIASTFPGVDLSDAIAFEIGRAFPNPLFTLPMLVLGLVMLGVGLWGSFGPFFLPQQPIQNPSQLPGG